MLVIEGKQGKSRILVEEVEKLRRKVGVDPIQIIDYVGIPHVFGRNLKYCTNTKDMQVKDFVEHYRRDWKSFEYVDYLILELNAPKEILDNIKSIEKDFNKKIIVTVQNNEKTEIDIYEY